IALAKKPQIKLLIKLENPIPKRHLLIFSIHHFPLFSLYVFPHVSKKVTFFLIVTKKVVL
ncbi:hypothetical protein OVV51_27520, partial [Klebsiella pneumoniae]|nr:hypothetical protein [Klebsiella pneumoniae]